MLKRVLIDAIGFDLDGTLYESKTEMDDRIRDQIALKMLDKLPNLRTQKAARLYFEDRYKELGSGGKVLKEIGYENPAPIIDECLAKADILDFLKSDPTLSRIMRKLSESKLVYLITSSPEELALQKLERLGISPTIFSHKLYSDSDHNLSKTDESAFRYMIKETNIPAINHVYIGDRKGPDILPANTLGMQTIAVWSNIPEATLSIMHIHQLENILL